MVLQLVAHQLDRGQHSSLSSCCMMMLLVSWEGIP